MKDKEQLAEEYASRYFSKKLEEDEWQYEVETFLAGFDAGAESRQETIDFTNKVILENTQKTVEICTNFRNKLEAAEVLNNELLSKLATKHVQVYKENKQLEDKLKIAHKALSFYGSETVWATGCTYGDDGAKAREALTEIGELNGK